MISQRVTWVHDEVAVDIARACSREVRRAISRVINRYVRGEVTTEESRAVKQTATSHLVGPCEMTPSLANMMANQRYAAAQWQAKGRSETVASGAKRARTA